MVDGWFFSNFFLAGGGDSMHTRESVPIHMNVIHVHRNQFRRWLGQCAYT